MYSWNLCRCPTQGWLSVCKICCAHATCSLYHQRRPTSLTSSRTQSPVACTQISRGVSCSIQVGSCVCVDVHPYGTCAELLKKADTTRTASISESWMTPIIKLGVTNQRMVIFARGHLGNIFVCARAHMRTYVCLHEDALAPFVRSEVTHVGSDISLVRLDDSIRCHVLLPPPHVSHAQIDKIDFLHQESLGSRKIQERTQRQVGKDISERLSGECASWRSTFAEYTQHQGNDNGRMWLHCSL